MNKKLLTLCAILLSGTTSSGYAHNPYALLKNSKQLMVVVVPDVNQSNAVLRLYQRKKTTEPWTLQTIRTQTAIPVVIGLAGLAWSPDAGRKPPNLPYKRENDRRAPAGIFALSMAFGIEENKHPFMPYIPINRNIVCVDDGASQFYNHIVDQSAIGSKKDWAHAETMNDAAPMYNTGLQVAYNPSNIPGNGSCIFLHQWRRPGSGTAGCTAMESRYIKYLVNALKQQDHPTLVQLPQKEYAHYQKKWHLPPID